MDSFKSHIYRRNGVINVNTDVALSCHSKIFDSCYVKHRGRAIGNFGKLLRFIMKILHNGSCMGMYKSFTSLEATHW